PPMRPATPRPSAPGRRSMYPLGHRRAADPLTQATSQTPRGGTLPASTILLIDADPAFAETISKALTSVGYSVTVSPDPAEALPKVSDHRLVIVDVIAGERTGVDVCREIRETPSMASIPVLCVGQTDDVEDRIRFLEAGADDVMARPFDARELEARVQALMLRFQRSKDIGAVISPDGVMVAQVRRTIAVHSPPHGPEQAELITPDHVDKILSTLLETYDQIVIDTGSWLDERTLRAFENAENVVFVVNPEVATLKAVNLLVEYLNEAGTVA